VAGTLGAEHAQDAADAGFRPDGSIRVAFDLKAGDRVGASVGYGYSRVSTLSRAGAYASHTVTAGLDVGF
jgi:hypothetical protein